MIARSTPGFSGADLENLVNESVLHAARNDKEQVSIEDFEYAKDKVTMGVERKSMLISEKEKKITAYHEAGHALVAKLTPEADPIHKVTIIPRGMALGVTQQLPLEDKYTLSRTYLLSTIKVLLGGRAAEELVFSERTSGAANDLERVTDIAKKMVCEGGMSEVVGTGNFRQRGTAAFSRQGNIEKKRLQRRYRGADRSGDKEDRERKLQRGNEALRRQPGSLQHDLSSLLLEKEVIDSAELDELVSRKQEFRPEVKKPFDITGRV